MKKLRYIFAFVVLLVVAAAHAAEPTASQLVDAAAAKLRDTRSATIAFTATDNRQGHPTNGTFTIAADKFVLQSPDAKIWYDGKTQWTWSAASEEVDITEPTIEEIAQVNPYAIINSLRTRYKARYLGKPADRTVVLTPAMPDPPVTRAEIAFAPNGYPSLMKLNMASGESITIKVLSVKVGGDVPISTFQFAPSKAPGAEIVDLR